MARVLSFEREHHEGLDFVPLGVRRKLDLAGIKVSLDGWRALAMEDRRALRDEEVGADAAAFAGLLRAAAARAGVTLEALPAEGPPPWRSDEVPEPVRARLAALGAAIDAAGWRALDDEARYLLLKLAEKKREPERFAVAAAELGLIPARPGDKEGAP